MTHAGATIQRNGSRADIDNKLHDRNRERGLRFKLDGVVRSRLLLGKRVHRRRVQYVVHYSNSGEESSDAVTDLRSHVLTQQLRRVRVNGGHIPIELASNSVRNRSRFMGLGTHRFVIQPGEAVHNLRDDRCPSHDVLHLSVRSQLVEILEHAHAKREESLCDLKLDGLVCWSRIEIQPQQDSDESRSTAGLLFQQVREVFHETWCEFSIFHANKFVTPTHQLSTIRCATPYPR